MREGLAPACSESHQVSGVPIKELAQRWEEEERSEGMSIQYRVSIHPVPGTVDGVSVEEAIWTALLSDVDPIALIRDVSVACYSPAVKAKRKRTRKAVKA